MAAAPAGMLAGMQLRNDHVLHAGCTQAVLCSITPSYVCTRFSLRNLSLM